MNTAEAHKLASGYAWGCEDSAKVPTASPSNVTGDFMFAEAFAQGYADYNANKRASMTDVRSAYTRWQETGGATIFRNDDTTADHAARRAQHGPLVYTIAPPVGELPTA
jgi:hypothetical protein